ncbi:MAG TPA: tetratricopeptide repeat protein [Pyrinomonadaceae bacterium]|nr:tetratricopeptide repeat protein [Pyrinomonadaceae bacterium]
MRSLCPSCGAETFAGARFCRRCGAAVRAAEVDAEVSPTAGTVPLTGEPSRTTDSLGGDEKNLSPATSRVSRAELERILKTEAPPPQQHSAVTRPGAAARLADGDDAEATLVSPPIDEATRPAFGVDFDEELTITVPRPAPAAESAAEGGDEHDGRAVETVSPRQQSPQQPRRRAWPFVLAASFAVLLFATAAGWFAYRYLRGPSRPAAGAAGPVAPPAPDARQLFEEKLAEAEGLLAQGDITAAMARLREANSLDPANTRARLRLGELLWDTGARREAIEELRAASRSSPEDFTVWRRLATAQFAEGLYADAAESYRRLIALAGAGAADPNDLLSYADALRNSGRAEEAAAVYKRLASGPAHDFAELARVRLGELAQPTPQPTPTPRREEPGVQEGGEVASSTTTEPAAPAQQQQATPTPQPTPAPQRPPAQQQLTPAEHYRRGVELWSSNRAAAFAEFQAAAGGGVVDANYYLGLSYVEGKNPRALNRAALLAALRHFQIAQRGQFAEQSRRYARQLEQEFDRTR